MCIPEKLASDIHMWSDKELQGVTLVFDGGVDGTPPISAPAGVKWTSLRISSGDLYVADTLDDSKGLIYLSLKEFHRSCDCPAKQLFP